MLKKILASVGIGKATVDTILLNEQLRAGEPFAIEVVIKGGEVEQELNGLEFAIMAEAKAEKTVGDDEVKYNKSLVLQSWKPMLKQTIQPGETITRQFNLDLHPEVPATSLFSHRIAKVWLQTGLDIKNGIDGSDKDPLIIVPSNTQLAVLELIESSGYRLFKSDLEVGYVRAQGFASHLPCYQEYEFKPESRSFFGAKELEVTFIDNGAETGVLIEIDRAFSGDGYHSTSIPNYCDSVESVRPYIERLLG
ncbi:MULTISPECIES: sporulation protein [unclassified Shewanella]|uniref:sporulation protein n=1 Tax=unclassified Shewanella TaxID=196818 RepID=UPI001BBB5139|nr:MULTISPECIES: sporulation protein [unclassified Shewanella]GIU05042.1 sporulation-control protein [Shewanella sp. MBTL60-112-B1]GIU24463.1 sporulation-control protein [Shewanella sp. MBTL60-112-B2]